MRPDEFESYPLAQQAWIEAQIARLPTDAKVQLLTHLFGERPSLQEGDFVIIDSQGLGNLSASTIVHLPTMHWREFTCSFATGSSLLKNHESHPELLEHLDASPFLPPGQGKSDSFLSNR